MVACINYFNFSNDISILSNTTAGSLLTNTISIMVLICCISEFYNLYVKLMAHTLSILDNTLTTTQTSHIGNTVDVKKMQVPQPAFFINNYSWARYVSMCEV